MINISEVIETNKMIEQMAERGIATNVHYKPLPMMTAYKALGFDIKNYPNAYHLFENEITLPLHTCLSDDDVEEVLYQFHCLHRDPVFITSDLRDKGMDINYKLISIFQLILLFFSHKFFLLNKILLLIFEIRFFPDKSRYIKINHPFLG